MQKVQKSVGVNAVLNAIKASLSVIFPLITFPYATRVLGVENLGKVNYSQSIEHYFALIAALGITTYAVREGSKLRDDKTKIEQFTNEVFTLNICTTACSYILLFFLLIVSKKMEEYRLLILLQSLSIIFSTIGVDWLNTIYEDYLLITVRGIITNIASMVVLFLLVKTPEDYYIYAMLTVLTNAIIGISNLYYCRRYTKIKICFDRKIFRHLKSSIIFFANSLAVSIYVSADTTMLGWMVGDYYVGIYAVAVKVYNIIKTMLASLYVVAIPRLSYYVGSHNEDEFKKLYSKILTYLTLLLLPCMAGLISLSKDIILLLSGEEYLEATRTLQILGVALIFSIFGGVVTNCLNIPLKREIVNMRATVISAAVNVVLNIFFISQFKHNGAAMTTVISEFLVFSICAGTYKGWKRILELKSIVINCLHAIIGAVTIILICGMLSVFLVDGAVVTVALKVGSCITVYSIELILLKNKCALDAVQFIRRKIKK